MYESEHYQWLLAPSPFSHFIFYPMNFIRFCMHAINSSLFVFPCFAIINDLPLLIIAEKICKLCVYLIFNIWHPFPLISHEYSSLRLLLKQHSSTLIRRSQLSIHFASLRAKYHFFQHWLFIFRFICLEAPLFERQREFLL